MVQIIPSEKSGLGPRWGPAGERVSRAQQSNLVPGFCLEHAPGHVAQQQNEGLVAGATTAGDLALDTDKGRAGKTERHQSANALTDRDGGNASPVTAEAVRRCSLRWIEGDDHENVVAQASRASCREGHVPARKGAL